jgi:hypothetical protein
MCVNIYIYIYCTHVLANLPPESLLDYRSHSTINFGFQFPPLFPLFHSTIEIIKILQPFTFSDILAPVWLHNICISTQIFQQTFQRIERVHREKGKCRLCRFQLNTGSRANTHCRWSETRSGTFGVQAKYVSIIRNWVPFLEKKAFSLNFFGTPLHR